jgi:hypothetical protein
MLSYDENRRPQAVAHMLNDPVAFGLHGLTVGHHRRAPRCTSGLPSLIGPELTCRVQSGCCSGTGDLGRGLAVAEGINGSTLGARLGRALCAVALCASTVREVSRSRAYLRQTSSLMHERLVTLAS